MSDTEQLSTLEAVKAIIRRDLNLDDDETIEDDMPLVGGEMDLDSLDVLMLITSIEKRYGVKIVSDEAGKAAFASVATLAAYIDQQASQLAAGDATGCASAAADLTQALDALPHRAPFRFVSELIELVPGERGVGRWRVTGEEDFFAGHFPGQPLVPGVLTCEALAQLSGVVHASASPGLNRGQLAASDVRFRKPVAPPATIVLHSKLEQSHGELHVFAVHADVQDDEVVAEGRITLYQPGPVREDR